MNLQDTIKTLCKELGTNSRKVRIIQTDTIKSLGYCWHDACYMEIYAYRESDGLLSRLSSGSCMTPNDPMIFHRGQDTTIPEGCVIIETMTYPKQIRVYQRPVKEQVLIEK
jgi:hypothetical protein